jgi:catechol 2,3-dioxygenase-like lactoylglutathione lyase family enzyme
MQIAIMQNYDSLTLGVDHLGLTVSDIEASRGFFVDCLGWRVVGQNMSYPAVFVSDGFLRLTLWQVDWGGGYTAFDRRKNIGLHHLAIKVTSDDGLQDVFSRISAWPGVVVEFAPEHVGNGPSRHCMVREPGGTRIEFRFTPAA